MIDVTCLDAVLTPTPAGHGPAGETRFTLAVPDGWQQGRGAFGGLVLGSLVRAAEVAAATPDRRVRTVSGEIVAPVAVGEAEILVAPWRSGSAVTVLQATLRQEGAVLAAAVIVLGSARPAMPTRLELAPPAPTSWRDHPTVEVGPPIAPVFTQHLEYRVTGPAPYAAAARSLAAGWVRARQRRGALDAAHVLALADAYWPSTASTMDGFRPIATVAFTLHLVADPASLDPEAPLFHRATCPVETEGYAVDARELWTEAGELVAVNQQTFVIIK